MEQHQNNQQFVSWPKAVMVVSGYWNQPLSSNRFKQNLFNIYSFSTRCGGTMVWLSLLAEMIHLVTGNYSKVLMMTSVSVCIYATKIWAKLMIFLKNGVLDMFGEIIKEEEHIWKLNSKLQEIYIKKIRICKIYVCFMTVGAVGAACIYIIPGAIATVQLKHLSKAMNATEEVHYMYMIFYPRDKLNHLLLTFAAEFFTGFFGASLSTCSSFIILSLLLYVSARLEILQMKLRDYIRNESEMEGNIQELKELVKEHTYIIDFVERLNNGINSVLLMEFVLSSCDTASTIASFGKVEVKQTGFQLIYLVLLTMQIYILGWNCNEVNVQSSAVADAIYESKWYLLDKEGRQMTQIMMMRAQKPLAMTIGPFGPMTNNTSLLITKAAYSYISIMK